jgi:hypothetical protein
MAKVRVNNKLLLERLEELAQRLDVTISYDRGLDGPGGFCRVKEEKLLLVNRDLPLRDKIDLIAETMIQLPIDDIFIIPELREYLECLRDRKTTT